MEALKKTANYFLTIPVALFTILAVLESMEYLTGKYLIWINWAFLGMFCLGLALYLFWGAAKLWGTTEYTFHIHRMKPSEMDISIELSKKLFPVIPTKKTAQKHL